MSASAHEDYIVATSNMTTKPIHHYEAITALTKTTPARTCRWGFYLDRSTI